MYKREKVCYTGRKRNIINKPYMLNLSLIHIWLVLVNVNQHVQEVIKGVVLIAAVAFDCLSKSKSSGNEA